MCACVCWGGKGICVVLHMCVGGGEVKCVCACVCWGGEGICVVLHMCVGVGK